MKWYLQSKCNRTADISVLYNHEKPSIVYQSDDYHVYTYMLILLASIEKVELKANHFKHVQLLDKCISSLFLITKEITVVTWSLDITSYICRWFLSMFTGHTNHTVIRSGGHSLLRHPLWSFLFFQSFIEITFQVSHYLLHIHEYSDHLTCRQRLASSTKKNRHLITWRHIYVSFSAL